MTKNMPASGVYRAPADVRPLRAAAERARLAWFEINLDAVAGKKAFLAACARSLRFPRTFGSNWDALADCLKDLCADSVVECRNCTGFAEAAPDDYATALEIFKDAASYWHERGSVFLALADAEPEGARLPRLDGPKRAG
jgi:hypothetical protein